MIRLRLQLGLNRSPRMSVIVAPEDENLTCLITQDDRNIHTQNDLCIGIQDTTTYLQTQNGISIVTQDGLNIFMQGNY